MYDPIHEQITVSAVFEPGKRPQIHKFIWNNTLHTVTGQTLITKARKGRELVWMFHITTDTMAFKIRLDTDTMNWWLEEMSWDSSQNYAE